MLHSAAFSFLGVSVATCMAILQVGSGLQLRSASTGTKEEDYENDAATIVQKCVSIMRFIINVKSNLKEKLLNYKLYLSNKNKINVLNSWRFMK